MKALISIFAVSVLAGCSSMQPRESIVVPMSSINEAGTGASIGTVKISATADGVLLEPDLRGLAPGEHGFHIHEKPDCAAAEKDGAKVAGLAAGGHYDPSMTKSHAGPQGSGHLGDLPALKVGSDGRATQAVTAPRLTLAAVRNRALMTHAGGDNYADQPSPLGGGGARVACGVIK